MKTKFSKAWRALITITLIGLALPAGCASSTTPPAVAVEPTRVVMAPTARPAATLLASARPTATPAPSPTAVVTTVSASTPTIARATVLPTPQGDPLRYARVEIAAAGLAVEVPVSWQRLGEAWAWSGDGAALPRVEVRWKELVPPLEAEAALLPSPSAVLESTPVTLGWGSGRRITIEVYGSSPSGDVRAPVQSVETHVLVLVAREHARYAYDFAACARTLDELKGAQIVLEHLVDSSQLRS